MLFWVILVCLGLLLFMVIRTNQGRKEETIALSDFVSKVNGGDVKAVHITGQEVHGVYKDDRGFTLTIPPAYNDIYKMLQDKGVAYDYHPDTSGAGFRSWCRPRHSWCCWRSGSS